MVILSFDIDEKLMDEFKKCWIELEDVGGNLKVVFCYGFKKFL